MNFRTSFLSLCLIFLFVQANAQPIASIEAVNTQEKTVAIDMEMDIVDIAAGNESFATLVAAVKAADLVATLKSEGPFTVFAPTNDAFRKLPEGTVATLLKPENKDQLSKVLTYHVVAGKLMAEDVVNAITSSGGSFTVKTVSGDELVASIIDGGVVLKDENGGMIKVTATDVKASNGVIHVIDSVLLPK